ncbi:MAG: hypothetical protein E6J91_12695 [Deltaproteobacteria bacterium]|nr:MAG: hypothetical protein E6J91_12695 [Deltaproteobacteria bacterium]
MSDRKLHHLIAASLVAAAACTGTARGLEAYRADTARLLDTRSAQLQSCYDDALKANDKLGGSVTVPVERTAGARHVRRQGHRRPGARAARPQ